MTEKLTPPEERAKPPSSVAPVSTLGTASAITRRMEFTLETPMPIVSVKNVEYQVRPYTNFGKYEGGYAIDPYIHGLTLDGFCDEEYGSVTENGMWYGIIRGPISVSASDRENNDMTESEISFLSSIAGIIAQESDVGFVGIKYYVSQEEFDNDTKKIEAELSDPDMNDDEDDQIGLENPMRQIGSPDEYRESNDRHYEYSLWYRPASSFTVPDDYLKISPPSKDYPFGTVSYAKPLSREQISAFELSPLDPNDPINIEKEYRKFHEKFMSEFTKSDENYRSPKGFVVTRSTVPGVEWQLTQFCKDQPSGHIDFSDFNELTRTIWGMERNNSDESKNKK